MNLDFEVNGIDEAIELRLRASKHFKDELHDILDEASRLALESMRADIPDGRNMDDSMFLSGSQKGYRTIRQSLDRDGIVFRPGAFGGGGYYVINVGAIDNPPKHLEYVFQGTRAYGYTYKQSNIKAYSQDYSNRRRISRGKGNFGKLMLIPLKPSEGGGRARLTFRKGQRPQQEWFRDASREANRYIQGRVRTIGNIPSR